MSKNFPFYNQPDAKDCGPTCLRMIAKYYGKNYTLQNLRGKSFITREGVSMLGISDAAESIGLKSLAVRVSFEKFAKDAIFPCVVHWNQSHFVVVYKIKNNQIIYVADPAHGLLKYSKDEFLAGWLSTKENVINIGVALLLEPTLYS